MKSVFFALQFLFICKPGFSQQNKIPANAESLYNSEKEFSAYCRQHGIKESFLKYFDDKAISFFPHPVIAKGFYTLEPEDSGYLSWNPTIVEVSNDGKLGFTMGPVEYQSRHNLNDPVYYSHYFSVWQKKDGAWKVLLDKGVRYKEKMPNGEAKFLAHSDPKNKHFSFANIVSIDNSSASKSYKDFYNNETIFGRQGHWPFTAKDSLPKDLEQIKTWKVLNGQIASSADLAYMFGVYELNNEINEKGYFLRVWTYQNRNWFLRVDIRASYKK